MIEQIIIIGAILSFLIIGFLIKKGKISTIGEFSINRDKLKWFPIAAGISMTYAGGAVLLNISSLGYIYKWYPIIDALALVGAILIVVFFIKYYRKDKGVTISDLLSNSNKKLSILIGVITSFVFIFILAAQFVALSKLLIPYFPNINSNILTLIPSILIFGYIVVGGFTSVTRTDILQLFFIIIFFILPIVYILSSNTIHPIETEEIVFDKMSLNLIILLSIFLLYIPLSQDINIRVKSATSSKQAKIGLLIGACFYVIISICSIYIGITLKENGVVLADSEKAFSTFFIKYAPNFGVVSIIAALAAIVSSLDSVSLNAITSISNDLLKKNSFFKNYTTKSLLKISSIISFIIGIIIALYFNEILFLVLTSLLIYISTLIPVALAKKLKIDDNLIFLSTIILITTVIVLEIFFNIELKAVVYPLIGLGLMILFYFINLFTQKNG